MSTPATIIAEINGKFHSIYINFDGSTLLPLLNKHYAEISAINKLLGLGNLSSLGNSADCPDGLSFNNQTRRFCVAYGRDGGEKNQQAKIYPNIGSAKGCAEGEYGYATFNGVWERFELT